MLTLGQAAKHVSVSKATLSRAIKSGRISAHRNDKGEFAIDPAELFRVFQAKSETPAAPQEMKRSAPPQTADEAALLAERIRALEAHVSSLREQAMEIREQRDSWQKQAEQSQRLLSILSPSQPEASLKQVHETVATLQEANAKQAALLQELVSKIERRQASFSLARWFGLRNRVS